MCVARDAVHIVCSLLGMFSLDARHQDTLGSSGGHNRVRSAHFSYHSTPRQREQIGALYRQMLAHEGIDPYWVGIEVSACKSAQAWARATQYSR